MRFLKGTALVLAAAFLSGAVVCSVSAAEKKDMKLVGIVTKIDVAEDGKSAQATLKSKGKLVVINISDELTLNKFKVKKIQVGDEIRCTYTETDGAKQSLSFKKSVGC